MVTKMKTTTTTMVLLLFLFLFHSELWTLKTEQCNGANSLKNVLSSSGFPCQKYRTNLVRKLIPFYVSLSLSVCAFAFDSHSESVYYYYIPHAFCFTRLPLTRIQYSVLSTSCTQLYQLKKAVAGKEGIRYISWYTYIHSDYICACSCVWFEK